MVLGIIILKKTYSAREYFSVLLISIGIFMCTLASANEKNSPNHPVISQISDDYSEMFWWTVGIIMLTLALVLSAVMGLIQEKLYATHGKRKELIKTTFDKDASFQS